MLTLQKLRVLEAVADSGSFTRAAHALHYSQSAVSQHIAALEEELGMPLVVRLPRGVELTHAGRLLHGRALEILQSVRRTEQELAAVAGLEGGEIRLASFATAGAALMPRAMAEFHRRHPAVQVHYEETEPDEGLPRLVRGELDLVVVFDYAAAPLDPDPGYTLEPLVEEPLFLAVPRSHAAAGRASVRVGDFAGAPWIDGSADSCRAVLRSLAAEAPFDPRVVFESDDYGTIQGMVAAGIGMALLPAMAALQLHPELAAVPLSPTTACRRVFSALPDSRLVLPAARAMADILKQEAPRAVRDTTAHLRPRVARTRRARRGAPV